MDAMENFFADIWITLPKIVEGTHQTLRFKWVFELREFEL